MSTATSLAQLSEYFIRKYALGGSQTAIMKSAPTLGRMAKETSKLASEGFYTTINAHLAYQAPSEDFAKGMANGVARKGLRFFIDGPKQLYTRVTIDGLTLARSTTGSLIDLKAPDMDDAAHGLMTTMERKLWGDDVGSIARVGSTSGTVGTDATTTFTLSNTQDIYNIEYGAVLSFNSASTGVAATKKGDTYRVTSVDHAAGTFLGTMIDSGGTIVANNDYIWIDGGQPGDNGDVARSIPGIPSFIPAVAPTDTFLGLARSGLGPLAYGWRQAFTGTLENTIQSLFVSMSRFVHRPNARWTVCLSAGDWFKLANEVGDRVVRDPSASQTLGTDAIMIRSGALGGGVIPAIVVPALRDGRGYVIDWSSWTMHHLGGLPHIIQDDGKIWQRQAPGSVSATAGSYVGTSGYDTLNGDGVECRFRAWFHPMCVAPASNGTFATA